MSSIRLVLGLACVILGVVAVTSVVRTDMIKSQKSTIYFSGLPQTYCPQSVRAVVTESGTVSEKNLPILNCNTLSFSSAATSLTLYFPSALQLEIAPANNSSYEIRLGDANGDGSIDEVDYELVSAAIFNNTYAAELDIDGDKKVTALDLAYTAYGVGASND